MQAVFVEAIKNDGENNDGCERKGYDDVARDREGERDQANQIGDQHEHKEREDEREETHALMACRTAHGIGYELVSHFTKRLETAGNERFWRGTKDHHK